MLVEINKLYITVIFIDFFRILVKVKQTIRYILPILTKLQII
jgi:hypothetical protein